MQDILDKILLANSLLSVANRIHLLGEVGLAALYALGIKVGRVERTEHSGQEYEMLKEFFFKLFNNAIDKGVKLFFPLDLICT